VTYMRPPLSWCLGGLGRFDVQNEPVVTRICVRVVPVNWGRDRVADHKLVLSVARRRATCGTLVRGPYKSWLPSSWYADVVNE
jgi:hypothetical protein